MARAISSLQKNIDTIIVAGGHLGAGSGFLFASEDAVQTPRGALHIDGELRALLQKRLDGKSDKYSDNTVEVLLPAVHYFFPTAKIIWMRAGEDMRAYEAGRIIGEAASELGRCAAVIASTDLTHYGSAYDFTVRGAASPDALKWVKEVNDRRFIEAVLAGNAEEILSRAVDERSACSAGGVLAALGFSSYLSAEEKSAAGSVGSGAAASESASISASAAQLLQYTTSADTLREIGEKNFPDSFVGYAALKFL
jgi:AmmeMemoRadiSam system protein B